MYQSNRGGHTLLLMLIVLLIAAFFRTWMLTTAPPGMSEAELINAQLSESVKRGELAVVYNSVLPAREGVYHAGLALWTTIVGGSRGVVIWRIPSVWLSLLTLAITFRMVQDIASTRTAFIAVGLMAVSFWPVWLGRAVLHTTLVPLASALILYVFHRAYEAREFATAGLWFTVGALIIGLAQYIHVSMWIMIPMIFIYTAVRWSIRGRVVRRHLENLVYASALTLITLIPLWGYLARNPGSRNPPIDETFWQMLLRFPGRYLESLGTFIVPASTPLIHNLPGQTIVGIVIGTLMLVGLGISIARWRNMNLSYAVIGLVMGLIPAGLVSTAPNLEAMSLVMPLVFLFAAVGLEAVVQALSSRRQLAPASGVALLLVAGTAVATYFDYFVRWPQLPETRVDYQAETGLLAHFLDVNYSPSVPISVCSFPIDVGEHPFALTNAELLHYLMHRPQVSLRYFNCTQSLILAEGGTEQFIIFPKGHYYDFVPGPMLAWFEDAESLNIDGVGPDVVMKVDVSERLANQVGVFITTAPTAWPPEVGPIELAELPVEFEGNVTFLGYTFRDSTLKPTDLVEVVTYWRLDGPPPPQITMFTHLLGNPVIVLAQEDSLGLELNTLQSRDVFLQYSRVRTPAQLSSGTYPVSIGIYFTADGRRLVAFDDGDPRANRLFLGRIQFDD